MMSENPQCEKHAKKEEAVAKLRDGAKFDEVAREFSEDKARQGNPLFFIPPPPVLPLPPVPGCAETNMNRRQSGLESPRRAGRGV